MHIPRVFVDVSLAVGSRVSLIGDPYHHLARVLRLKTGARVVLFNGRGGEYTATFAHATRKAGTATVDAYVPADREPTLELALWQGVARGKRMDYVLQKAVELGVGSVRPLVTRYSATGQSDWHHKIPHWRGVIISACEQSGRTRIPELDHPQALQECIALDDEVLGLVLDPQASRNLADMEHAPRRVTLLVGPEGGFCDEELALAQAQGFKGVRLGPRTLRTETAAVAALTAVQLLWGDL